MELSGTEAATPEPPASPRQQRSWGRRGLVAVGILSAAALVAVALAGFARASDWKDRADDRAERVVALEDELRAAEAELRAVETRVGELTEEVATAQDQRSVAEITAEQAQELADLSGAVARDLASCVDGTNELVRVVRAVEDYDPTDATEFAETVDEVCGRALAGNDLLQDSLGQAP